jgi:uncharacterized protein YciI
MGGAGQRRRRQGRGHALGVYVVVFLRRGENAQDEERHAAAHEAFIDSLIARHAILLGGPFGRLLDDVDGAYVLPCRSLDDAREIASRDPLVVHRVSRAECIEWQLVGIDVDAIEST